MQFFFHLTMDQKVCIVLVMGAVLVALRIVDAVLSSKEDE